VFFATFKPESREELEVTDAESKLIAPDRVASTFPAVNAKRRLPDRPPVGWQDIAVSDDH